MSLLLFSLDNKIVLNFIFKFITTHGDIQGLLLALHSGMTSESTQGRFGMLGNELRSASYKASTLSAILHSGSEIVLC